MVKYIVYVESIKGCKRFEVEASNIIAAGEKAVEQAGGGNISMIWFVWPK